MYHYEMLEWVVILTDILRDCNKSIGMSWIDAWSPFLIPGFWRMLFLEGSGESLSAESLILM